MRIPQIDKSDTLPRFVGLSLDRIVIPSTPVSFSEAASTILSYREIGFDTESKPTFKVGEISTGPQLIQFATQQTAYLFRVGLEGCAEAAMAILESDQVLKIGFGLGSDRSGLRKHLGVELRNFIDLGTALRYQGKKGQVGLRGAVAALLGARINKSRSVATSDWSNRSLTDAQQLYAANDAYAALAVYLAFDDHSRHMLQDRVISGLDRGCQSDQRVISSTLAGRSHIGGATPPTQWRLPNDDS